MDQITTILNKLPSFIIENSHFDFHSIWFRLLIMIVLTLLLSFLVNFFLVGSVLGQSYRVFVAPGVILHELSHALFCLLTGAKIKKIALFDKEGGSVEHEQSKVPVIGPILISLAPFVTGSIAIFFFAKWLGLKEMDLSSLTFSYDGVISFLKSIIHGLDLTNYKNWIIIYLALSVAVTMTPSKQDVKNIAITFIALSLIIFSLVQFTSFNLGLSFIPVDKIILLLNMVAVLLILSLILSIIIFTLGKFFKR